MTASPSVLRHTHKDRKHTHITQSPLYSPSQSPVLSVNPKIHGLHYPPLNISQGPSPSFSSPNFQTTHPIVDHFPQHKPTSRLDSRYTKASQLSSKPFGFRSNPSLSSSLSIETSHGDLLDSLLQHPSLKPTKMLSSQKNSNPGCLSLTSSLAPPSLVDTCASAPPPSSSRKKAKTRLHLGKLPQFPQPPTQSPSHSLTNTMTYYHQYDSRAYFSAQQQLQYHQKDLIQQATRASLPSHLLFPVSPRLIPCGSPGPVTPLTLEESSGYMTASSTSSSSPGTSLNMPFLPQMEMDKLSAIAATQT